MIRAFWVLWVAVFLPILLLSIPINLTRSNSLHALCRKTSISRFTEATFRFYQESYSKRHLPSGL